ncbi:unnamed protein product [Thlaspi arvense]|uniref:Neprosin PEP catalytic domain-containing protein n=1 Tax=Thlaspi arvense TaxID=13288 RepID=A0AAU9RJT9_THLAR|nr:unnamed protein product [Thlaspi arvense]
MWLLKTQQKNRMALVMNLLLLSFLVASVRTVPLRSFKIGENVTYDCIDIYKQSGLDHLLLKKHTIQMKPSVSRIELKSQIGNKKKEKDQCPDGTVPVLRNTKEFITNAQFFAKKYIHPLTTDSPGTHIAGVRSFNGPYRGVEALFDGYNLNVGKNQASYNHIYLGSGVNNEVDFISTGLMVDKSKLVWRRTYFVIWILEVSQVIPIVKPHDLTPGQPFWLHPAIHQDKNTGNWWITLVDGDTPNINTPNIDVGYWPKELFNFLNNGANMVGVRGMVQTSPSGSSPPMGNGKFPTGSAMSPKDRASSAIFSNIQVLNSNFEPSKIDSSHIENVVDSTNCYVLRTGKVPLFHRTYLGYFFNYGGLGGNSCGV